MKEVMVKVIIEDLETGEKKMIDIPVDIDEWKYVIGSQGK